MHFELMAAHVDVDTPISIRIWHKGHSLYFRAPVVPRYSDQPDLTVLCQVNLSLAELPLETQDRLWVVYQNTKKEIDYFVENQNAPPPAYMDALQAIRQLLDRTAARYRLRSLITDVGTLDLSSVSPTSINPPTGDTLAQLLAVLAIPLIGYRQPIETHATETL